MFDQEGLQFCLRRKISLENKLSSVGESRCSIEIKSQMIFIEDRLLSKIKQAYDHAGQEFNSLRMILIDEADSSIDTGE